MTDLRGHIAEAVHQRGLTLATLERIADDVGVPQGSRATDAQLAQILARVYTPSSGEPVPDAATGSADVLPDSPTPAPPNDLMDDILQVTNGEDVTPEPGTVEHAILRAEAKAAKAKVRA